MPRTTRPPTVRAVGAGNRVVSRRVGSAAYSLGRWRFRAGSRSGCSKADGYLMIRLLLVYTVIAAGGILSFRRPLYAMLLYLWVAYFRPEYWVYSSSFVLVNLSFLVGAWVVIFSVAGGTVRLGTGPLLVVTFIGHGLVSSLSSPVPDVAFAAWTTFAKIGLLSVMLYGLVRTPQDLRLVLIAISISLAAEGAKQGWAQMILNPGQPNRNTLPMLGDNNGVALGMLMIVSFLVALSRTAVMRVERWGGGLLIVGVFYRAISTYSRGGFLAAIALGFHTLVRSNRPVRSVLGGLVVLALIYPVLPDEFWARMDTITLSKDQDQMETSAASRLHLWAVAMEVAEDHPLVGVGLESYPAVYDRYDFLRGHYGRGKAAHSAWFGLLADVGYLGLAIFLSIVLYAFWSCWTVRRIAARNPELADLAMYSAGIEGALIVFVVAGSFLSFQYAEVVWHTLVLAMAASRVARDHVAGKAREAALRGEPPWSPHALVRSST